MSVADVGVGVVVVADVDDDVAMIDVPELVGVSVGGVAAGDDDDVVVVVVRDGELLSDDALFDKSDVDDVFVGNVEGTTDAAVATVDVDAAAAAAACRCCCCNCCCNRMASTSAFNR